MLLSKGFSPQIQGYIMASEGGYVDHPKDPGGATNMGITFAVLQAWRGRPITKADVKNLTKDEAIKIYKAQYWDTAQCSKLPLGLDYMVMDYGVNSGAARAIKDLQRTVGSMDDGVLGQKTLALITQYIAKKSLGALLEAYAQARWAFMQGLSTFSTFGVGWRRRVWGNQMGAQANDIGVVDRALKISKDMDMSTIPMPLASVGQAQPERPDALALFKDPATLTGITGAFATVVGAIQGQPILQAGAILSIGGVLFFYIKHRRQADPS